MLKSPFDPPVSNNISIPDDAEVVFVSDFFVEDLVGGAELTSEALIEASPFKVFKLHSKDVSLQVLEQGIGLHWVFGNYSGVNPEMIPSIVGNMEYSVLEYDYKYCKYRSPEKHKSIEMKECDCHEGIQGKMISAFMYGAKSLWWMSERQQQNYFDKFPFLSERPNVVLSSVFNDDFFAMLKVMKEQNQDVERSGWLVLGSTSWIKGTDAAVRYCEDNNLDHKVLLQLPYAEVLDEMSRAEGFVYLPQGGDTCPRMVIEAKLLGCKLHINDNVEHANELWFDTDDTFDTMAYLYAARKRFWDGITHAMEFVPTLSGYTTTLDCNKNGYPWKASIKSMLGFCNEVVVVDGGSTDGTWKELQAWAHEEDRLNVYQVERDWGHPRFAVFDGQQKAEARSRCTGEFCWQQDADEVVHENDYEKIPRLLKTFPVDADVVSLPVVEYWGSAKKARVDVNPWKWRISRNAPHITHGIPAPFRMTDDDGNLYASPGTDGCDYIHNETYQVLPHASFYTSDVHNVRLHAAAGSPGALEHYTEWYKRVVEMLPGVYHYSWFDLERKIKTYRDYWSQHWQSLYNIEQEDTAENNMFFERPWSEVTDNDITELATKLEDKMGGWVFHVPINFDNPTPHITLETSQPAVMVEDDSE